MSQPEWSMRSHLIELDKVRRRGVQPTAEPGSLERMCAATARPSSPAAEEAAGPRPLNATETARR
jgi:hypothetical protein